MAVRERGADRVIWGSDVPRRSFSTQLGKVHSAVISNKQKAKILSQNLRRLMLPILQEKGIEA